MKFLSGLSVLLVGSHAGGSLPVRLRADGAVVTEASDALSACALARDSSFDVVVADLPAGERDSSWLATELRQLPAHRATPIIAINVDRGTTTALDLGAAGLSKRIARPCSDTDVALAIVSCAGIKRAKPEKSDAPFSLTPHLERRVARSDIRGALALLNSTSVFRFTAVFRFEGGDLISVWTYDRNEPEADLFPLDVTVNASYCSFVRDTGEPFTVDDARIDPRVAEHPKRHELLSYCGVALRRADDSMFGSLCHFDVQARAVPVDTVGWLESVAKMIKPTLA